MTPNTDAVQARLRERLAAFTCSDPAPFVSGRIVEPTSKCFPEAWTRDEAGLSTLAQRMLSHAGVGDLHADVSLGPSALEDRQMLPATELALVRIEDNVAYFDCRRLGRSDDAAFALVSEVALVALLVRRADSMAGPYRSVRIVPLVPSQSADEQVDATVLAVHLGLGVLAAMGAHIYRQAGRLNGGYGATEHQHVAYGHLPAEAVAYLLAVQLAVRGFPSSRVESVIASLTVDRRDGLRATLATLDRSALIRALGLPRPETWEVEQAGPVPSLTAWSVLRPRTLKARSSRPVFRVQVDSCVPGLVVGGLMALAMASVVLLMAPSAGGVAALAVLAATAVGLCSGGALGSRRRWDQCSGCYSRLRSDDRTCSRCLRPVAGRIARHGDRLDAEERLGIDGPK